MKRQLVLLAAALLLSGCADTINGKSVAEPEVARFHEKLKARDFEGLYESTSAEFKEAAPKARILALFEAIDRKLGDPQGTKQVNWNVSTYNLVTTVVLVYSTRYQEGEATETFTFRVKDNTAELLGYDIASLDMLIK